MYYLNYKFLILSIFKNSYNRNFSMIILTKNQMQNKIH